MPRRLNSKLATGGVKAVVTNPPILPVVRPCSFVCNGAGGGVNDAAKTCKDAGVEAGWGQRLPVTTAPGQDVHTCKSLSCSARSGQ